MWYTVDCVLFLNILLSVLFFYSVILLLFHTYFLHYFCPFNSLTLSFRVELALQQNEIMDIFYDDYVNLADDDGIVGNKTNSNLKVRLK